MPANTTASSPKKKKGRRARLLVIVLVLALVAGVGYGTWWSISTVRASFPQTTGTIKLEGLKGQVEVKRDGYGIPQIYADSDEDLFRAQGFVQAQDRFWEMDVRRHMTAYLLLRDVRFRSGRDRFLSAYARLAPGGAAGVRHQARLPPRSTSRRTRTASTPISRVARAGTFPSSTPRSSSRTTTSPRSGRPSTRWPGSRRWPGTCAATCRRRSTARC